MDSLIAHDISSVPRTEDVILLDSVSFQDMFFSEPVFKSLCENGFLKPSPIQYKAIPLARCGFDLIVQSKSGTGKTLVFVTTALESIDPSIKRVQVIVLTPTREIALQVTDVFKAVGSHIKDLQVECFIGGVPLPKDIASVQACQVAVGAPGRIHQLIELGHLKTDAVRLFILDEADQLMAKSFQNDINFIYWSLSEFKQMLALSATYPDELVQFLGKYMRSGKLVTPETDPIPVLKGLKQFVSLTRDHPDALARLTDKENRLVSLLSSVKFNQCLIFSNYKSRAESTCNMLKCRGWSCGWISGGQAQDQRTNALNSLKIGLCRILVTTDLTARGIDSKGINLVINMDTPYDPRVYLHRMGRAGRYGSHGVVVTILSKGPDLYNFRQMLGLIDKNLSVKIIPTNTSCDLWSNELSLLEEVHAVEPSAQSIERYKNQFASTESRSSTDSIKGKVSKKGKVKRDENSQGSQAVKAAPDLGETNFPSIPAKKTTLNDYFLNDSTPGEFFSLTSLKESLDKFHGNNVCVESPSVSHNKEIGSTDSQLVKGNSLKIDPTKKIDQRTKWLDEDTVDSTTPPTLSKPKTTNVRVKSIMKNVPANPSRRFSYSDIAKGKRVECKPVNLKPEQVENLKKSPLKLFPSESVSNQIEGVRISDKTINGFSKRMYSSVLKDRKVKLDSGSSRKSSLDDGIKVNPASLERPINGVNPNVKALRFNPVQDDVKVTNKTIISNGLAQPVLKKNLDERPAGIKEMNTKSKAFEASSNHPSNSIYVQNYSSTSVNRDKLPLKNKDVPKTVMKDDTQRITADEEVERSYTKISNLNHSESIPNMEIFNSSFSSTHAVSSPIRENQSKEMSFLSNQNSFYESRASADLSRISFERSMPKVTFDQSTTSDSSDSEGEYIISGSFAKNCSFFRMRQNRISNKPKPASSLDSWFKMYYQQASLIHNYVKYSNEYHLNQSFS